jgi:hypothetical protein
LLICELAHGSSSSGDENVSMKKAHVGIETQERDQVPKGPAKSTDARSTTQSVAFRVIGFVEDEAEGRTPVWGACPLTEEERTVLRCLSEREAVKNLVK